MHVTKKKGRMRPPEKEAAIGVFDSGLGGLTVVKALMELLPDEEIVYYGDTARVPYGTKSREAIVRYSLENARVLLDSGVKLIVVACNSSSSYALPQLKRTVNVPVLGVIDPGVAKAAECTRNRRVGVIATQATVRSGSYVRSLQKITPRISVQSRACPLFVPLVEEGWFDHPVTRRVASEYLGPMKEAGIDTLILGCTHYPLLKPALRQVMGPGVQLVDSAQAVAEKTRQALIRQKALRPSGKRPRHRFLVSDTPRHFRNLARRFMGHDVRPVQQVRF